VHAAKKPTWTGFVWPLCWNLEARTRKFSDCQWCRHEVDWGFPSTFSRGCFRDWCKSSNVLFRMLLILCAVWRQPIDSSFVCSAYGRWRPPSSLVSGQESTICDIVWMSPQTHISLSVRPHFCRHVPQWPCPVWNRFSNDHWRRVQWKAVGLWDHLLVRSWSS